jgi:hypothetical protein
LQQTHTAERCWLGSLPSCVGVCASLPLTPARCLQATIASATSRRCRRQAAHTIRITLERTTYCNRNAQADQLLLEIIAHPVCAPVRVESESNTHARVRHWAVGLLRIKGCPCVCGRDQSATARAIVDPEAPAVRRTKTQRIRGAAIRVHMNTRLASHLQR